MNESKSGNTVLETRGKCYEVMETYKSIRMIMNDDFISSVFIELTFPDGCKLSVKKSSIEAFYSVN